MTPLVPLIAHYNGQTGRREASLQVVAIMLPDIMLVLYNNRLISAHQQIPGLMLDRIEEVQPVAIADPAVSDQPKKPGRPKKIVEESEEPGV